MSAYSKPQTEAVETLDGVSVVTHETPYPMAPLVDPAKASIGDIGDATLAGIVTFVNTGILFGSRSKIWSLSSGSILKP